MNSRVSVLLALIVRDLRGMVRRPSRMVAVIVTPLLVWGFMATGFGQSGMLGETGETAVDGGGGYTGYLLPGIAVLLVVLSSVMGAIALIQDRHDGILPALLVSPADRWVLAVARIASASLIAMLQALVVIPLIPLSGGSLSVIGLGTALLVLLLVCVAVSGLSLAAAWKIDSIAGFHGVMNLVLMPMWLLSGSIAPVSTTAEPLQAIVRWNPLGAAGGLMRGAFGLPEPREDLTAWALTIAMAVLGFAVSVWVFGRGASRPRTGRRHK